MVSSIKSYCSLDISHIVCRSHRDCAVALLAVETLDKPCIVLLSADRLQYGQLSHLFLSVVLSLWTPRTHADLVSSRLTYYLPRQSPILLLYLTPCIDCY